MASNMMDFYETWNLSLLSSKEHIKTANSAKLNLAKLNLAKVNSFIEKNNPGFCNIKTKSTKQNPKANPSKAELVFV